MADIKRIVTNNKARLPINGAIGVIVLCLLGLGLYQLPEMARAQSAEYHSRQEELRLTESRIKATRAEIVRMQRQKDILSTENGVEEAARSQLGMVRQGEVVYVVDKNADSAAAKNGKDSVGKNGEGISAEHAHSAAPRRVVTDSESDVKPSGFFRVMGKVLY